MEEKVRLSRNKWTSAGSRSNLHQFSWKKLFSIGHVKETCWNKLFMAKAYLKTAPLDVFQVPAGVNFHQRKMNKEVISFLIWGIWN